jgi:hypothetical protein
MPANHHNRHAAIFAGFSRGSQQLLFDLMAYN